MVHRADLQDRDGAKLALRRIAGRFPRLRKVWADTAYRGKLVGWAEALRGWALEVLPKPAGFAVQAKRWIVERTFGWLNRYRRLAKDHEELPESSETMICLAMTGLMLNRLAPR